MNNKIPRILSLVLAVLVLCAPIGAMADSYNTFTLTLSDFKLALNDTNFNIDATLSLDVGIDPENGTATGAITALAGDTVALKGGFNYDGTSITAGIDGMTQSVLIPAEDLMAELESAFSDAMDEEQTAELAALVEAYMGIITYMSDADHAAAYGEKVLALLNERFGDGYKGQQTLDLGDLGTVNVEQYDFSLTIAQLMTLSNDILNADPELAALYQKYFEALGNMTDEDIAGMLNDPSLYNDIDMTMSGSFYYNEEGAVVLSLDIAGTDEGEAISVPIEFICLPGETAEQIHFYMQALDDGDTVDLTITSNIPTDGSSAFDVTIIADVTEEDGDANSTAITLFSEGTDGATDITMYCENTSSYTYDGEAYEDVTAFGFNYAGTSAEDETGLSFPGTLTLYMESSGTEINVQFNTNVQLNTTDASAYTVNGTPVDVTTADEDTLNALGEDASTALMNGVIALMSAPGLSDMLQTFGVSN